jgi:hypothetical protein
MVLRQSQSKWDRLSPLLRTLRRSGHPTMPLLRQLVFIFLFSVSSWAQSGSLGAQHNDTNNPQAQPTHSNTPSTAAKTTYALEPIDLSRSVYPLPARQQKIQGQVSGVIVVSETGSVETVQIFKGERTCLNSIVWLLARRPLQAVYKDGKAVAVISKVTFNFVLGNDNQEPKDVVAENRTRNRVSPACESFKHSVPRPSAEQNLCLQTGPLSSVAPH